MITHKKNTLSLNSLLIHTRLTWAAKWNTLTPFSTWPHRIAVLVIQPHDANTGQFQLASPQSYSCTYLKYFIQTNEITFRVGQPIPARNGSLSSRDTSDAETQFLRQMRKLTQTEFRRHWTTYSVKHGKAKRQTKLSAVRRKPLSRIRGTLPLDHGGRYLWQQAQLETTHPHEKKTNGSKNQRPILAHR